MTEFRNKPAVRATLHHPRGRVASFARSVLPALAFAASASLLAESMSAEAADVVDVRGDAKVVRGGTDGVKLAPNATLRAGDRIVTGANGRVELAFRDGARFSVAPGSDFRIDAWRCDDSVQRCFLSLARGAVRAVSGKIGKKDPDDWRLVTPTATVGIRGTEFEVVVFPRRATAAGAKRVTVEVFEGKVVVENDAGSVLVPAGRSVLVASRTMPARFDCGPLHVRSHPARTRSSCPPASANAASFVRARLRAALASGWAPTPA